MSRLPVLLSIPHGGTRRPPELDGRLCITERDQFDDSDPFVIEIYDLGDSVWKVVKTDIARAYVDLNRPREDLPERNPDGLIKSSTCYRKPIYIEGMEPDTLLSNALIEKYYDPYYGEISDACMEPGLEVCLDCHSMAGVPPDIAPDPGPEKRPLFCLSNREGRTSSDEQVERLAACISESFGIGSGDVSINRPFKGGHITKSFGNNPLPWIQVEMNRELYLDPKWFDRDSLRVSPGRLAELNRMFGEALVRFFD